MLPSLYNIFPPSFISDSITNKKASKQTSVRDKKISTVRKRIVWNSHLSENKVGANAASIKGKFSKIKNSTRDLTQISN
ncbi:hypothetical protein S245_012675 [Arachis hypogaea]